MGQRESERGKVGRRKGRYWRLEQKNEKPQKR